MTSAALEHALGGEDEVLLDNLILEAFDATPPRIGPFGASRVRWSVGGPVGGMTFELNRRRVEANGDQLFTPERTQTFELAARIRKARRVLGRVAVQVDLSRCETVSSREIRLPIDQLLRGIIEDDPDLYFRQRVGPGGVPVPNPGPVIDFARQRIHVGLPLKVHLDFDGWPAPDPSVDIKASFGVRVANGIIVPLDEEVTASVSVPWYVWLVPGAMISLPIALGNAEERARAGGRRMVQGITTILNFFATPGPEQRLHSVALDTVEDDDAVLDLTFCPDVLLRRLAEEELAPIG